MPEFQLHCCGAQDRALPGNRTPRLRSLPLTGCGPARGTVSVSEPGSLEPKPDAALLRCPWPGLTVGGTVETGRGFRWAGHTPSTAPCTYHGFSRVSRHALGLSPLWSLQGRPTG